jgi:tight adherence protein B
MDNATIAIVMIFVAVLAVVGGFAFILFGNNSRKQQNKRLDKFKERFNGSMDVLAQAQMRKILARQDNKIDSAFAQFLPRPAELRRRLERTGKKWTMGQYGGAGVLILLAVTAGLNLGVKMPVYLAVLIGAGAGLGLPHFVVSFIIKSRGKKFNLAFPDALDLMVRGLRSGLPITESMQVVGREIPDPVGIEFRMIADKIRIGRTMEQALMEATDKIGTPEFKFFMITIAIQRETGGNLAETLSNLSDILRKRVQLKLKIKAMSSEAKASAYIVGVLPFLMFGVLSSVNPDYMSAFWTNQKMIMIAGGGLTWMGIGVFIMAKMVSFEI